jgi:hypothetical protein
MLYYHILDKICVGGPKLSNFKIRGPILQNDENKGTKTAIKPLFFGTNSLIFREKDL